ncbi:Uncharacterised protein [Serratia fonticola]|uniref:Uncharacterized protein n=1 Tax=Serratia fonticola TaxID=47917 RepID=A0A4U9W0I9_SERFO|nr:Uncharacterised protein [Serratia fonticola]
MRVLSGIVMAMLFAPVVVQANEATEQKNLNKPAVRGSIIGQHAANTMIIRSLCILMKRTT